MLARCTSSLDLHMLIVPLWYLFRTLLVPKVALGCSDHSRSTFCVGLRRVAFQLSLIYQFPANSPVEFVWPNSSSYRGQNILWSLWLTFSVM